MLSDRFDLRLDGTYRGFEDFCVLNAKQTDQKYSGSYETSILKLMAWLKLAFNQNVNHFG
jgi:serine/threonine-protein kinase HipA